MLSFLWSRSMIDGACSNWCDDDNFSHGVLELTDGGVACSFVVQLQWLERNRSNQTHHRKKKVKRRRDMPKK